jgi:MFS transporter, ACS family, glucarate transporter
MVFPLKFPYRFRVSILLYFLILITYLDRVTISLVGLRIKNAFHLSNTQFGWVLGSFALAYAIFEIPSAILGDHIGQRKVFLRIVLWWSIFTALTGAVNGLTSLILVRFLFGMGESGAYPNSCGTISRWFSKSESTRATSWLSIGSNSGAALAPLIVVPIAIAYGWRAPFFVNGFIGLIWVSVCWLWFRNHPRENKKISFEEIKFIEDNRSFSDHKQPFPWKLALRNPMIWVLVMSYFCSQWANYFFVAWMPNYLQEGKHFSEQDMKTTMSYMFLLAIFSASLCGIYSDWLIKQKGKRFTRSAIGMGTFIIMAILIFISVNTSNHALVIFCLIGAHACLGPNVITFFSTCVDIGGDWAATLAGIMNFFGQAGAFAMSVIFGNIVDLTHSFEAPQFVMVGVLVFGALGWLLIDASKKIGMAPKITMAT